MRTDNIQNHLDDLRALGREYSVPSAKQDLDLAVNIAWAIETIERLLRIATFAGGLLSDVEEVMSAANNAKLTFDRLERQLKGFREFAEGDAHGSGDAARG